MALLCARVVLQSSRRNISYSAARLADKMMPDPIEHATGIEQRELCAKAAGNENPFDMKVLQRGPGTKNCPNLIPSAFDARIVGCICEEDATAVQWMWLYKGDPRRCDCGHWFKLAEKAPV